MNLVTAILGLATAAIALAAEIVGLVRQSGGGDDAPEAGDKQERGVADE